MKGQRKNGYYKEILIIRLCIYYQVSTYESHTKFLQISEFKRKIEIDS